MPDDLHSFEELHKKLAGSSSHSTPLGNLSDQHCETTRFEPDSGPNLPSVANLQNLPQSSNKSSIPIKGVPESKEDLIDEMRKKINGLREALLNNSKELVRHEKSIDALKIENNTLQNTNKRLTNENTALQDRVDDERSNTYRRKKEIESESEKIRAQLEAAQLDRRSAAEELAEVTRKKAELARQTENLDRFKKDIKALKGSLSKAETKVKELEIEQAKQCKIVIQAIAERKRFAEELESVQNSTKSQYQIDLDRQAAIKRLGKELLEANNNLDKAKKECIAASSDRKWLAHQAAVVLESESDMTAQIEAATSELKSIKRRSRNFEQDGTFHIRDESVIRWLSSEIDGDEFEIPPYATVIGEYPLPWNQMLAHLTEWECKPYLSGCEWIIVGREGWTPEALDELIKERDGDSIKIVSQELFIAAVVSGHDPFCGDQEALLAFAKGHPALQHLLNAGFEWPFVGDWLSDEPQDFFWAAVERSPLKEMAYTVGESGLYECDRRDILTEAFKGQLPWVDSQEYMDQWGKPGSRHRLHRMAHHIKRQIDRHRGILNHDTAVCEWEEDLDWLHDTFYKPWMRFNWPEASVG